jgi:hypothetical protein
MHGVKVEPSRGEKNKQTKKRIMYATKIDKPTSFTEMVC